MKRNWRECAPSISLRKPVRSCPTGVLLQFKHTPSVQGALFLPHKAGQIAALRQLIATWLRLAIFETMNGPEGDQRLWFVIDELDALGQIDGLKDALARLRKFGGRCVRAFRACAAPTARVTY